MSVKRLKTAPTKPNGVSIGDVMTEMASSHSDLGYLAKEENVNMFAKFKPLRYLSASTECVAVQCDESGFTHYKEDMWKGVQTESGNKTSGKTYENGCIIPTLFQYSYSANSSGASNDVAVVPKTPDGGNGLTYKFATTGPKISGYTSATTWDNTFNTNTASTASRGHWLVTPWKRDMGKVARLSDFANYNHSAEELFTVNFPSAVTLNESQTFFTIKGTVNNRDLDNGLVTKDFNNVGNVCLKIGNYEVRNQFSTGNTIAFPIPKCVYSGKTSITPIVYMRGKDKNNKVKYMGCKFSDNTVISKTIPITILSSQYKLHYEFGFIGDGMYCTTGSSIHHKYFHRNSYWYLEKERMGRADKEIRLYNFYWRAWLTKPSTSTVALPAKDITFQCVMQDEEYYSDNCLMPAMILGEYKTHYNGNANDLTNYQGYFYETDGAHSSDASDRIRFYDVENQELAPQTGQYYAPLLTALDGATERYTKEMNIWVRARIRMRVLIDGVVFDTIDVPNNGNGRSFGYIWDNTTIKSTKQTQLTNMLGGYAVETYTATTNTACTILDNFEYITNESYSHMEDAAEAVKVCTEKYGTANYLYDTQQDDTTIAAFKTIIYKDTSTEENKYLDWGFDY